MLAATWMERIIPPCSSLSPLVPQGIRLAGDEIALSFVDYLLGVSIQWWRVPGDAIARRVGRCG